MQRSAARSQQTARLTLPQAAMTMQALALAGAVLVVL